MLALKTCRLRSPVCVLTKLNYTLKVLYIVALHLMHARAMMHHMHKVHEAHASGAQGEDTRLHEVIE